MRRRSLLRCTAVLCTTPSALVAAAEGPPLRIGLTAVILADQAAFLARWSAYLTAGLGSQVVFVVRDSYQAILDLLFAGQLDGAWICGFPYVRYQRQMKLLAVPLYAGHPLYQSYLIRAKGSDAKLRGWGDLRGKVFAYSDPLSNSGWLVAQGQLAQAGLSGSDFRRAFFAHGHRNVAEAVAAQLADAGAIDGYVWDTMRLQGMSAVEKTEVLWKSPPHGFPPLVAMHGAAHPKLDRLQQMLLAMPDDPAGRELLQALNLSGFIEGRPALFDSIRRLALSVPGSGVAG